MISVMREYARSLKIVLLIVIVVFIICEVVTLSFIILVFRRGRIPDASVVLKIQRFLQRILLLALIWLSRTEVFGVLYKAPKRTKIVP